MLEMGLLNCRTGNRKQLATVCAWIDGLPEREPTPERPEQSESREDIDIGDSAVLHPGDPGYDDEDDEDEDEKQYVMMAPTMEANP